MSIMLQLMKDVSLLFCWHFCPILLHFGSISHLHIPLKLVILEKRTVFQGLDFALSRRLIGFLNKSASWSSNYTP